MHQGTTPYLRRRLCWAWLASEAMEESDLGKTQQLYKCLDFNMIVKSILEASFIDVTTQ